MDQSFFISPESIDQRNHIIEDHRRVIFEMRRIEKDIEKLLREKDPRWKELEKERNVLYARIEPLVKKYWEWVPGIRLSRCPFCRASVWQPFDPVDLNGFWWMDRTQRPSGKPKNCEHFRLLSGALDLKGQHLVETLFEINPGPGKPFVIPRILKMPTMTAVASKVTMRCGFEAVPIAYFSKTPPPAGSLTQSWARKEYRFTLDDGRSGWDIKSDEYDFELDGWIREKKFQWTA